MIREYRSPKTPFNVEVAVNPGKQKSARIDWGFFMQKVYPNIDTTFRAINFNEYATYTVTIGHSLLKNTYTNPRRPIFLDSTSVAQTEPPDSSVGASHTCRISDYRSPPLVSQGGIYPRCDGGADPLALSALTDGRGECVCYQGSVNIWVNACALASRSRLAVIDNAVYCPGF